jgi:4-aminobutyrate aminotransferase
VRGRGLSVGVELVSDQANRRPAPTETAKVAYRVWQLGAVVYPVGPHANVLEITPPLVVTDQEVDHATDLLDQALADVAAGLVPDSAIRPYRGW